MEPSNIFVGLHSCQLLCFHERRPGNTPNVDVSKTIELKKRLGCKPFVYFLHRFRKAGMGASPDLHQILGGKLRVFSNPKNNQGFDQTTSGMLKVVFIWVFPKIGVPQNRWFIMKNPIKMDDLGVPLFLETPI